MKKILSVIFIVLILFGFYKKAVFAGVYDKYLWETPKITNISSSADDLIKRLRDQVDLILNAGHLAPLRISGSDQIGEGYYMYFEPGRIITTLAMAYPYLSTTQQQSVRIYVNNELANPDYTIWSSKTNLAPDVGARREYFLMSKMWQWDWFWGIDGQYRPRIGTLYGLWLYAYNSGDWAAINNNWSSISSFYTSRNSQANIYGNMGAHIAMARMARQRSITDPMVTTATTNAENSFTNGLNFSWDENQTIPFYDYHYNGAFKDRKRYNGWMFLNLTPEVGRYIKDNSNLKNSVLVRHNLGKSTFPIWWVTRPWYENGYSGHESSGVQSEIMGMIFPIEKWVLDTSSSQLLAWQTALPSSIGDCYAVESMVMTIQSAGVECWEDIRNPGCQNSTPNPTSSPSFTTTDLKILLTNWQSNLDSSYYPKEGKVNALDASYVIRWILP